MRFRRGGPITHKLQTGEFDQVDVGELSMGGGALAIIRPRLEALAPGGWLIVIAREPALGDDLRGWCRREGHRFVDSQSSAAVAQMHCLERGPTGQRFRPDSAGVPGPPAGRLDLGARMSLLPPPDLLEGRPMHGLRGAEIDRAAPATSTGRQVIPPETGRLYEQALAAQWDPRTAIPWRRVAPLEHDQAWALSQIMTFLAENELAALQVPASTLAGVHPAHAEVAMLLALHMADEARHLDVFLERARLTGQPLGASSATTGRSLASLRAVREPIAATFLLSVLGEGTFLDLLAFVERYAPDEATRTIARRTRADESRHVHLGIATVRHALTIGASTVGALVAAIEERAARVGSGELPPTLQDALVLYAAGRSAPDAIARGHDAFRALLDEVERGLAKRIGHLGLARSEAIRLARLHTPSFM